MKPLSRRPLWTLAVIGVLLAGCTGRNPAVPAPSTPSEKCRAGIGRNAVMQRGPQRVWVHLPACYDTRPSTRYAVLILIHGSRADGAQWIDIGATTGADRLTRNAEIAPTILVMPDDGEWSSAVEADNAINALVPWVDATFRTVPDRNHRAIGGISRGGAAALRAAAARPDLFGAVGGLSPTVPGDPAVLAQGLRPLSGRIALHVGSSDMLRGSVEQLAAVIRADGSSVELGVADGGHDRAFWRKQVPDFLRFFAAGWR